ncbi:hypothetical protein N9F40_01310 [bacterium]|nr:hypothetical protein [bacterium]
MNKKIGTEWQTVRKSPKNGRWRRRDAIVEGGKSLGQLGSSVGDGVVAWSIWIRQDNLAPHRDNCRGSGRVRIRCCLAHAPPAVPIKSKSKTPAQFGGGRAVRGALFLEASGGVHWRRDADIDTRDS